jgi:hypothetical protein
METYNTINTSKKQLPNIFLKKLTGQEAENPTDPTREGPTFKIRGTTAHLGQGSDIDAMRQQQRRTSSRDDSKPAPLIRA